MLQLGMFEYWQRRHMTPPLESCTMNNRLQADSLLISEVYVLYGIFLAGIPIASAVLFAEIVWFNQQYNISAWYQHVLDSLKETII